MTDRAAIVLTREDVEKAARGRDPDLWEGIDYSINQGDGGFAKLATPAPMQRMTAAHRREIEG